MVIKLEKQFFETFRIKPKEYKSCDVGTFCPYPEKECETDTCPYYRTYKVDYPAINDHILLELICIVLNTFQTFEVYRIMDIDSLKEKTLKLSMLAKDDIYSQVRELFKERDL